MTSVIIQPEWFDTQPYIKDRRSADCVPTRSQLGRNATPLPVFDAVRYTLGSIELDVASDEVINAQVQADRIFTFEDDGFIQDWSAETLFLNAPGSSLTGGYVEDRIYWAEQLTKDPGDRGPKPDDVKHISAAQWYQKLYQEWKKGDVKRAVALHYRAGSIGSLGTYILELPTCFTCKGVNSPIINGSGRLAFEIIEDGERKSETSNPQSSAFTLFPDGEDCIERFRESFHGVFGVVK